MSTKKEKQEPVEPVIIDVVDDNAETELSSEEHVPFWKRIPKDKIAKIAAGGALALVVVKAIQKSRSNDDDSDEEVVYEED